MNLPKYQLKAEKELIVFEFISEGPKGKIPKLIKFTETHIKNVYNLGFGDKHPLTGEIDDLAVSTIAIVKRCWQQLSLQYMLLPIDIIMSGYMQEEALW